MATMLGREISIADRDLLQRMMPQLQLRAKDLNELAASALFYLRSRPIVMDAGARELLETGAIDVLRLARGQLAAVDRWEVAGLEGAMRELAEAQGLKLGKIAQPLRAAVTGSTTSPGIFDVLEGLGRDESLGRIDDVIA